MTESQRNKVIESSLTVLAILFGSVAFALSVVAGQTPNINWPLLIAGIISTAITLAVAAIEKNRANLLRAATEKLARDAEARYELMVSGLTPSVKHVARIAGMSLASLPLDMQRGRLDQSIAVSAASISPGSRGMFYRYDQVTKIFTMAAEWPGGSKVEVVPGAPGHTMMKRVVEDGRVLNKSGPPSPFKASPSGSGSTPTNDVVAVVQVRVGSAPLGVLAVDSDRSTWSTGTPEYSDRDIRQLLLLADLLGAGLTP
jgi:hypothetical protein